MAITLAKRAAQLAKDGKLSRLDAVTLAKQALSNGKVTPQEKKSLATIVNRYKDGFDAGGTNALRSFIANPGTLPTPVEVLHTVPFEADKVGERCAELIGTATKSVDAAFYEIADARVVNALTAAMGRGVKVRIVTDDVYFRANETQAQLSELVLLKAMTGDIYGDLKRINHTLPDAGRKATALLSRIDALEPKLAGMPDSERPSLQAARDYAQAGPSGNKAPLDEQIKRISNDVRWDRIRLKFRPSYEALLTAGASVVDDRRRYQSHNKFMVLDEKTVWAGSYNVQGLKSDDGLTLGRPMAADNVVVMESPELARIFGAEFQQMASGAFGMYKKALEGERTAIVEGVPVTAYFAPKDPISSKMAESLEALIAEGRKPKIRVAGYVMNYPGTERVVDALVKLKEQGADVEVVLGNMHARTISSSLWRLQNAGVKVEVAAQNVMMHHKFLSVEDADKSFVWTGSANFTGPAFTMNDETVLRLDSAEVASEYGRIWSGLRSFLEAPRLPTPPAP